MNIKAKLKGAWVKLAEFLTRKATPGHFERMNLHPDVCKAFQSSQKPIQTRETPSVMGTTSRGKNWQPRNRAWLSREELLPKEMRFPLKSPFMAAITTKSGTEYLRRHGTLERVDKLFATA